MASGGGGALGGRYRSAAADREKAGGASRRGASVPATSAPVVASPLFGGGYRSDRSEAPPAFSQPGGLVGGEQEVVVRRPRVGDDTLRRAGEERVAHLLRSRTGGALEVQCRHPG